MEAVSQYLSELITTLQTGSAREHAYRPAFKQLIENIKPELIALNDPARSEHGAPDFVFLKGDMTIGYTETKDIDADLDKVEKSEQLKRYFGYSNLILTNYLEFRFFRNGERYGESISIGLLDANAIVPKHENLELLGRTLSDFLDSKPEKIKSGVRLAKIMGGKARRIRENVSHYIVEKSESSKDLLDVYEVMKKLLVHDLKPDQFADMYAQTLVYGLFVARFHDSTPDSFSRAEARDLLPASNPFLRHFFDHIVGPNFDKRLAYIVNELCEVFSVADVKKIMEQYYSRTNIWGETKESPDPVIHFYEDFLKEYDSDLRKKMGAFYTPLPVVRFIVRSVDFLLQKEFNLFKGLADTTKTVSGLHKVQILDPAVGTGTFISAVIRIIYQRLLKEGQKGRWPAYVHNDLLPRLHGFELMMAPYTIAHLKLSMAFKETGFKHFNRRLGIYLTNSLEESAKQENLFTAFGLADSIAKESEEASVIKNEMPIMVVIGNPPYFGESSNKEYTGHDVYKIKSSIGKIKEKNSKWLNDDYVKFIRFAENMVEKNGEGIIGMITAHGWLDNPTFQGMRQHILNTFDALYILDLHGNSNKRELAQDGTPDKNIFNIKTGVAILLAIKKSVKDSHQKKEMAKVFKADILGSLKLKFNFLEANDITSINWQELKTVPDSYAFIMRDEDKAREYEQGFSLDEIFGLKNTGVVTKRDKLCIQETRNAMWRTVQDFINLPEIEVRQKYGIPADVRDWKFDWAKKDLMQSGPSEENIIPINYRPFDTRFIYYTGRARGFVGWPVERIARHFLAGENIGLLATKAHRDSNYRHIFVTKFISEVIFLSGITASNAINIPLYLYAEDGSRVPNLKKELVDVFDKIVGKSSPEDIFDYIYAFLHSPKYREKYKDFLRIGFPRVPYPKDSETFWKLVEKGRELRSLHLMESPKSQKFITTFTESGSNVVEKLKYENGNVYINETQYFGNVPEIAWDFYIGGYQPAQKWLKDRKGRKLSNEDLEHYQKMIVVLIETDRVMKEVDKIFLL